MLHHRCKNKRRDKRNRQRISYRLIMLVESIFEDIETERLVKVLEENFSQVVTFADDDSILAAQIAETGKHRMRRYITKATFLIEFLQSRLHRGDITDDTILGQHRQHLAECIQRISHRGGIDYQLRFEVLYLFQRGETIRVIDKTQLVRIHVEHCRFMLET